MKRVRFGVVVVLGVVLGLGCGGAQAHPVTPSSPGSVGGAAATPEDIASLARSNNTFGLALWSHLRAAHGNAAFSPASISLALGMTYAGARGDTASEMRHTLAFDLPDDRVQAGLGSTVRAWNGDASRGYELRIANRIFADRSTTFEPEFLAITRDAYGAEAQKIDFRGAPDASRLDINHWVESQTSDRIRDLLPQDSISDDVRMVLVNAIYFKGTWSSRFDEHNTRDATFYVGGTQAAQVRMMGQAGTFGYAQVDGVDVLEMPYAGDDLSMLLVMPEARDGLGAIDAHLDADTLGRWVAALRPQAELPVSIPRFKIAGATVRLDSALSDLGMAGAFREDADFTGMMPRAEGPLSIGGVYHQAFVEVNEQGTEAAAATAVVMQEESAVYQPHSFVADHPFLFFVRDRHTGSVLFMGRVEDPR